MNSRNGGTEGQWVQRDSRFRGTEKQRNGGTVGTEERRVLRATRYGVTVGTVNIEQQWVRRNRGTLGTEEQWVHRNRGYSGTEEQWVEQWVQRNKGTVGTEEH